MKKTMLFIFLIFQANVFSQDLELIVNQSKRWNVLYTSSNLGDEPPFGDYQITSSLRVGNEIFINGKNYHHIIMNGEVSSYLYIRENVTNQVYLYNSNKNLEWLLYNFDVEVGDVISLYNDFDNNYYDFEVENVSFEFVWDRSRKKIELTSSENGGDEVWYEGIGSMSGLIYSGVTVIDNWHELLCYFENYDDFHQNYSVCNTSTNPVFDIAYFNENTFVLDHFLINDSVIELSDGEYIAEFLSEQGNSNNVVEFSIGGMCGNSTSASVLVNTDSSLSILNNYGTTLQQCNPQYPNGDNQEERFFNILTGFFTYPNPNEYLPVYYEKSEDGLHLAMWTDVNEKLVFNVSERLGISDVEFKNQFVIFPNPLKDKLNIKTNISNYNLEIYNVLGKQVFKKQDVISEIELDISLLSKGIYLLKITNGKNSFTEKLVKK